MLELVGHYKIVEPLGAGGMAVVYRARDLRLDREVALKFLPPTLGLPQEATARMGREARAAASLDHPNIGTVHAIEETDAGAPYIVMALYRGETLKERLNRGVLPRQGALLYGYQTALGLAHAHQAGVVHRDIKPGNLFLTDEGRIKILDFGLAKLNDSTITDAGSVMGTFSYMSPEALRGEEVDARADLWALGVVLYELLTGRTPFKPAKGMLTVMDSILKDEPLPLAQTLPDYRATPETAALERLLTRALAKDPEGRFATSTDFAEALRALLPEGLEDTPPGMVPNNLPKAQKVLLGREEELAAIHRHLQDPRCALLTLVGQGGSGKTELALKAAREALKSDRFPDGIFLVELEAHMLPQAVPHAIAASLGVRLSADDPWESLREALEPRTLLLLLDNLEHLLGSLEPLDALLSRCPRLTLLVTSRERLNMVQERLVELGGLPLPPHENSPFEAYAATALFLRVATRSKPDFALETPSARQALLGICRTVQGWPLAIELAAVWVRHLSLPQIVAELEANVDFLTAHSRHLNARHRSVRVVFESSWGLLLPDEQRLLRDSVVFIGGFRREAAVEVLGASLEALASLVDKSLLRVSERGRYERHLLIYRFMEEKYLAEPERAAQLARLHAHYYRTLLDKQEKLEAEGRQEEAFATLESERHNLTRAWETLLETEDFAALLHYRPFETFLYARGAFTEALELFSRALVPLRHAAPSSVQTRVLGWLLGRQGWFLHTLGRQGEAETAFAEALASLRPLPPSREHSSTYRDLAHLRRAQGDTEEAQKLLEGGLRIAHSLDDPQEEALTLGGLAELAEAQGDPARALELNEWALERSERLGRTHGIMLNLRRSGSLLLQLGQPERATAVLRRGLALSERLNAPLERLHLTFYLAEAHTQLGDSDRASRLYERLLREAETLAQATPLKPLLTRTLNRLAGLALKDGQTQTAARHYRQALRYALDSLLPGGLEPPPTVQSDNSAAAETTRTLYGLALLHGGERALDILPLLLSPPLQRHDPEAFGTRLRAHLEETVPAAQLELALQDVPPEPQAGLERLWRRLEG